MSFPWGINSAATAPGSSGQQPARPQQPAKASSATATRGMPGSSTGPDHARSSSYSGQPLDNNNAWEWESAAGSEVSSAEALAKRRQHDSDAKNDNSSWALVATAGQRQDHQRSSWSWGDGWSSAGQSEWRAGWHNRDTSDARSSSGAGWYIAETASARSVTLTPAAEVDIQPKNRLVNEAVPGTADAAPAPQSWAKGQGLNKRQANEVEAMVEQTERNSHKSYHCSSCQVPQYYSEICPLYPEHFSWQGTLFRSASSA